ncbi:MAG: hypothetical protein ACHQNV_10660, partial [Vicinamibacteria bacterium]
GLRDSPDGRFWAWSVSVVNHRARVKGKVGAASGQAEDVVFGMVKESGAWKISSIALGGTDLSGDAPPPDPTSDSP